MRQGAHRTYARPHNTEQRRSPKPVTAERDIYPPEFNVNVPKIPHNSLFLQCTQGIRYDGLIHTSSKDKQKGKVGSHGKSVSEE